MYDEFTGFPNAKIANPDDPDMNLEAARSLNDRLIIAWP
jgi:hypothetical protein